MRISTASDICDWYFVERRRLVSVRNCDTYFGHRERRRRTDSAECGPTLAAFLHIFRLLRWSAQKKARIRAAKKLFLLAFLGL